MLSKHRARLESRTTRIRGAVHTIDHLLAGTGDRLLEVPMTDTAARADDLPADEQRRLAANLFNGVWRPLEQEDRTLSDDDRMLHMAHVSRYHWGEISAPENLSRGEWIVSRVYAVLGRTEPSRYHAERGLQLCQDKASANGTSPSRTRRWPVRTPSPGTPIGP